VSVAYLTVDEVNQGVATALAPRCQVAVEPVSFREWPPARPFAAVVYDLDSFPPAEREAVLTRLLSSLALDPVAVHSYSLSEGQVKRLRHNGVAVHRRLTAAVFLGLKPRGAEADRALRPGAGSRVPPRLLQFGNR
jgi:hypothetical protein